jgi:MFS superfamily sulfate permease-like transporter
MECQRARQTSQNAGLKKVINQAAISPVTSGGSNQLAHLSTALVVMLVLLFLTGPLQFLPVCVLGAIVFTIAVRLVDLGV